MNSLGFNKECKDTKVVVAMSGGVDSSVAAVMLKKEGFDVTGITLNLYSQTSSKSSKSCCAGKDINDAKGENLFKFAKKHKLKIAKIEDLISYRLKKEKLIKLKKISQIKVQNQTYKIKVFENLLDGSEHFALIKGKIKKGHIPRLRVISSNVVENYLINQKLPNSFDKTISYFKKFSNCVLVFIRDPNLQSVTQTLKQYNSNDFYKKGHDKLIKNYGIGAQIIKSLKIKNMILVTRSKKKVVGLDGYGIKIKKQEIIK